MANPLTRPRFLAAFAVLLSASPTTAVAAAAGGELTLRTERVVVYKDGHALFVKTAAAQADAQGEVHTLQVPDEAILGTFWAFAEGREIRSMRAESTPAPVRESAGACLTVRELLRANPGRQVTLALVEGGTLSGKLVELLELPPEPSALGSQRSPAHHPAHGASAQVERELTGRGGELVAIDTREGRTVIAVSSIRSVSGPELQTRCTRLLERIEPGKRLTFDLGPGAANKRVALRLVYFAPGVRWIPTYRVATGDGPKADLALQAELLNEAEDFDGAQVSLVVGVPNFRFKGTVSPLTLERVMRQALAQAAPSLMSQSNAFSNASFAQRSGEWRGHDAGGEDLTVDAPELSGAREQDLFVYTVPSLSLRKGERAVVPLWRQQAPQRHLYTFQKRLGPPGHEPRSSGGSPLRLDENRVWHQLELAATGKVPWTTGAALILRDELPLGQELLTYTPAGSKTLLPITVAVGLRAEHQETEIERQHNALRLDGESFSRVRRKGSLSLVNHQRERVTVRVSLSGSGTLTGASEGGKVRLVEGAESIPARLRRANPFGEVHWEIELGPGETRRLEYTRSVYE